MEGEWRPYVLPVWYEKKGNINFNTSTVIRYNDPVHELRDWLDFDKVQETVWIVHHCLRPNLQYTKSKKKTLPDSATFCRTEWNCLKHGPVGCPSNCKSGIYEDKHFARTPSDLFKVYGHKQGFWPAY